jgi:hypothetical protein
VRRFGWPAFYGDATRLDLLRTAGADQARVLVLAIDDVEQSVKRWWTWCASTFRACRSWPGRATSPLLPAARAGRDADRARDARLGADERPAACCETDGLERHRRATRRCASARHNHRADRADGAALRRRDEADRAGQASGAQMEQFMAEERQRKAGDDASAPGRD